MAKGICVFGDSITWGAFDIEAGGWVERLKMYCFEAHENTEIYNLGIPGERSTGLVKRFANESSARSANLALVAIGINDAKDSVPISVFQSNLEILGTQANECGVSIVWVGLTRVGEEVKEGYENTEITEYDQILKETAEKRDELYIPLDILNDADFEDGLSRT